MITVVILNWQRLENISRICKSIEESNLADEIIIWNNNPMTTVTDMGNAKVISCSKDFGLFTRFAAASLAKNECILYHDDDLMAPESTLEKLFEHWKARPLACHSPYGRNMVKGEYNWFNKTGPVEMVLTRYTMAHRDVCLHALSHTKHFSDIPGVPVGNGEDIILSFAAMDLSKKLNRAYSLPTVEFDEDDAVSIHKRYPEHLAHRTRVIKRCRKVFSVERVLLPHHLKQASSALKKRISNRLSRA